MKRARISRWIAIGVVFSLATVGVTWGDEPTTLFEGDWTAGGYRIDGRWSIVEDEDGRWVVLDRDFKTRRAPDLKIFLSEQPIAAARDRTATKRADLVAVLEAFEGGQRYPSPAELDLSDYRSILIHCERYSKYWGGSELKAGKSDSLN